MPDFTQFSTTAAMSIIAAIIATVGILVVRSVPMFRHKNIDYFTAFAAGVLITAAFYHIIPESLSLYKNAALYVVVGYFAMYIINRLLSSFVCHEHDHIDKRVGILAVLGIGTHSFIDGIVYSITFTNSLFTGFVVSLGMILHEFAEGAVTYSLLVGAGFEKKKAFLIAFFAAALTTPLGMLISYPFVHHLQGEPLAILLALSGGTLIYVGASHLIPHTEKEPLRYSLVAVLAGVAMAIFIGINEPHHHVSEAGAHSKAHGE
jgi:zinc and cadmium transporter